MTEFAPAENPIRFHLEDGIATVMLDRPAQRNALSIEAMNGLYEVWEQIDQDPQVRVAILTSSDCGTFCAGLDLKQTAAIKQQTGKDILTFMKDPFHSRMRRVKVPIIPGIMNQRVSRFGLYQARVTICTAGAAQPWSWPQLELNC